MISTCFIIQNRILLASVAILDLEVSGNGSNPKIRRAAGFWASSAVARPVKLDSPLPPGKSLRARIMTYAIKNDRDQNSRLTEQGVQVRNWCAGREDS